MNNLRICPNCGKQIHKINKVCPYCLFRIYGPGLADFNIIRGKEIVEKLNSGNYTLEEVAISCRPIITRERVRQLYLKITGHPYARQWSQKKRLLEEKAKDEKAKTIKFYCKGCSKPVLYKEGHQKRVYCDVCFDISTRQNRDPQVNLTCIRCGTPFHPLRNWKAKKIRGAGLFDKAECYLSYLKENHISPRTLRAYLKEKGILYPLATR